ncbi:DUF3169 family protein [Staphylococcus americanisciuri]|uniref:DUF3169 family protein n=1 Tax=Staphylococcus americanisciuri TaxID=2973940 RepID=A0ABT2F4C8_9STAP|nr:DUF3169 family protein [Staphylococcus americanisciuri]MCS4487336.1 DUF3169 family protein [Staphylococcus americanisciuri]
MKVKRYIVLVLLGGVIGGVIGLIIGNTKGLSFIEQLHFVTTRNAAVMGCIAIALIVALFVYLLTIQRKALNYKNYIKQQGSYLDMDEREHTASLLFWRTAIICYIQLFISLILLFVFVIGNASKEALIYVVIAFLLASFSSMQYGLFIRKYDPRFPKLGEKNYTEKTLALMDDAERHISLVSLYKIYTVNSLLLVIGIMILGVISISSQENYAVSLIILLVIYAYNIFGYQFKVRKFYK